MILSHSPHVPYEARAERVEIRPFDASSIATRRRIHRAVFCTSCHQHATWVLESTEWEPTPGVRRIVCDACEVRARDTQPAPPSARPMNSTRVLELKDLRPGDANRKCPVCDHVNAAPVLETGCEGCGAFSEVGHDA